MKALQALRDTPPCAYFCCCTCFGIKNINVTTRFDQLHQLFHKKLNIILKSIKDHDSVGKFGKIMCISHNMDHVYQCINKISSKSIHFFFFFFLKFEILTSIKAHNSVEKFRKITCASHNTTYTNFIKIHQFVLKILNGNKILTSIKAHNSVEK